MVYGDSLSLPRASENIRFYQTYPELIRQWYLKRRPESGVYVYNRSRGGAAIESLYRQFQMDCTYFGSFGEKVMILQCGIVDCAPRTIPMWMRDHLSKVPASHRAPIVNFLHSNRSKILNMGLMWRATPPNRFKEIYKKLLSEAVNEFSRVYVFNVLPTTAKIEKHSPGLSSSISRYNEIISEAVNSVGTGKLHLFDVHKFVIENGDEEGVFVSIKDGHHLTLEGHELLSEMVTGREKDFAINE